jgi:hypothetical protein
MQYALAAILLQLSLGIDPVLAEAPTPATPDWCAPPVALTPDSAVPAGPHFWVSADYLLWWMDGPSRPGSGLAFPAADGGPASGWRVQGGFWPSSGGVGLEAGAMQLERRSHYRFGR